MAKCGSVIGGDVLYSIKLWSLPDGKLVKTLEGHKHWASSVAIAPDGKLLASGDRYGSIRLWSLPDGGNLACLIDLAASSNKVKGSTYTLMDKATGQTLSYTLPCGSPIPPRGGQEGFVAARSTLLHDLLPKTPHSSLVKGKVDKQALYSNYTAASYDSPGVIH